MVKYTHLCKLDSCDGVLNLIHQAKEFDVGICELCGLKQLTDFNHINENFYSTNENLADDFKLERQRQIPWNKDRISLMEKEIGFLWNKKVLDYGTGTGAFLEYDKYSFFDSIVGYDLSDEACDINNNDGLKCYSNLDDLGRGYDIITLFHVLEHIKNPIEFLTEILETFKNTNIFVIEVPHTDEALVSLFKNEKYIENHYCLDHLWYFNEKTLTNVLNDSGLKIVYSGQLQRYPIKNHFKWLTGEETDNNFSIFEDLDYIYKQNLIKNKIADSLFVICERL